MEIIFKDVSIINKKEKVLDNISFNIKTKGIYSFVGFNLSFIGNLLTKEIVPTSGEVIIPNTKIGYALHNPYDMFSHDTIYEELKSRLIKYKYKETQIDKRIKDSLKIVDFEMDYLDKNPSELSLRDAKLTALLCVLIYNPSIIILDNITSGLFNSDKKDLLRLLKMLKNKYNKIIILLSKDTSFCYSISDYIYLVNNKVIDYGTREVLENNNLHDLDLDYPGIISFTKECRKKNHDIKYYTNILDLIKEVYRDVN